MAELSRTEKKQLDNSYKFGSTTFWECLEGAKGKNLDAEAIGMEILYQAVHFLDIEGWTEDEILKHVKGAYKDAMANQLYQQELSKVKAAYRQAGELTDTERASMASRKRILKGGDPEEISKKIEAEELAKIKPEATELN